MCNENIYNYLFSYLEETRKDSPKLFDAVISVYKRHGKILSFFRPILQRVSSKKSGFKFLFWGTKFPDLIKSLPEGEVIVCGGLSHFWFCIKHRIPYFQLCFLDFELVQVYEGKTEKQNLGSVVDKVSNVFKKHQVEFLILENDGLPLQRLLILAAKKLGIRTVCIQHGLLLMETPKSIIYGQCSDIVLTYDDYQKSIFTSCGVSKNSVHVIGPTIDIPKRRKDVCKRKNICILGQPFDLYRDDLYNNYLKLLAWLLDTLKHNNYRVIFKPHPLEKHKKYSFMFDVIECGDLESCFEKYDIYVSFYSTALYEATLNGKVSIQIYDSIFDTERFDIPGYAYSVDSYDESTLVNLISSSNPIKINSMNDNFYKLSFSDRFKISLCEQ